MGGHLEPEGRVLHSLYAQAGQAFGQDLIFHFGTELVIPYSVDMCVTIICLTEDCGIHCHMKQVVLNISLKLV